MFQIIRDNAGGYEIDGSNRNFQLDGLRGCGTLEALQQASYSTKGNTMDKNTPPKTSLKSLIRKAWKNRRDYDVVHISLLTGEITGKWDDVERWSNLGNVSDYSTTRTDALNIQLRKGNSVVFTFAYDN